MRSFDLKTLSEMDEMTHFFFDFDGVFTDNRVTVTETGLESVTCWRGDGIGIKKLKASGIACAIISSEANPVVTARAAKLGLDCYQGIDDKKEFVTNLISGTSTSLKNIGFLGNDINDEALLKVVGFPMVVADSTRSLFSIAMYITAARGGFGAVREVCELISSRTVKK